MKGDFRRALSRMLARGFTAAQHPLGRLAVSAILLCYQGITLDHLAMILWSQTVQVARWVWIDWGQNAALSLHVAEISARLCGRVRKMLIDLQNLRFKR